MAQSPFESQTCPNVGANPLWVKESSGISVKHTKHSYRRVVFISFLKQSGSKAKRPPLWSKGSFSETAFGKLCWMSQAIQCICVSTNEEHWNIITVHIFSPDLSSRHCCLTKPLLLGPRAMEASFLHKRKESRSQQRTPSGCQIKRTQGCTRGRGADASKAGSFKSQVLARDFLQNLMETSSRTKPRCEISFQTGRPLLELSFASTSLCLNFPYLNFLSLNFLCLSFPLLQLSFLRAFLYLRFLCF